MNISAAAARVNFRHVEQALDEGRCVDITLEDGRVFEIREKASSPKPKATAASRAAMFNSWQGKVSLIEGWDSPETNAEIWEDFWARLEDEEPLPMPNQQPQ